jgi:hypothetical protein
MAKMEPFPCFWVFTYLNFLLLWRSSISERE